jgi:hypothetical protein
VPDELVFPDTPVSSNNKKNKETSAMVSPPSYPIIRPLIQVSCYIVSVTVCKSLIALINKCFSYHWEFQVSAVDKEQNMHCHTLLEVYTIIFTALQF